VRAVDFTFDEDQEALRDTARAFLAAEAAGPRLRELLDDVEGPAAVEALWARTVALGWPGLLVPADLGGAGAGMLEAAVLCEEMGALPLPGPWLSSAVAGTIAAVRLGDDQLLAELAPGRRRATVAVEESGTRDPLDGVATTARKARGGWRLDGLKPLVMDGDTADVAYVVARKPGGGLATFAVEDPAGEPVPSLDVTRTLTRLVLDGRVARRVGPRGDHRELWARIVDDIGIALCAESVGAADRALAMASDYARQRVQFDRPIATFQVIRHKIVDMLHQLELARVATHYAAWASAVDDPQRAAAAAIAKGVVGEAAALITAENIQVHGGVGFTWDVDCHLLFRRVKANDVLFGRQGWQRQRLADLVIDTL
jgi:alkylation response protein AidB-like acyl-CoA dehydrogenase